MDKRALNKNIKESIKHSKGRFFAIMCLMMLGSFALVGLKVIGPDMRNTADDYFAKKKLTDVSIISEYGLDGDDIEEIKKAEGIDKIEFGYIKDVIIEDSHTSMRVFSKNDDISQADVLQGRLPEREDESAISNQYKDDYDIGDTLNIYEKPAISGEKSIKRDKFKVVGFIRTPEIIANTNMGSTNAGTGELNGVAVVTKDAFDSDVYMIGRITFKDTKKVDPYTKKYTNLIEKHKKNLEGILKKQPEQRLASIKEKYSEKIRKGEIKLAEAKEKIAEAENRLSQAKIKINTGEQELISKRAEADRTFKEKETEIRAGYEKLASGRRELERNKRMLDENEERYREGVAQYEKKKRALQQGEAQLINAKKEIKEKEDALEKGKKDYENSIKALEYKKSEIEKLLDGNNLDTHKKQELKEQLKKIKMQLAGVENQYHKFINDIYKRGKLQIDEKKQTIKQKELLIDQGKRELSEGKKQLDNSRLLLDDGYRKIAAGKVKLTDSKARLAEGKKQLADKKTEIYEQLENGEKILAESKSEYFKNLTLLDKKKMELAENGESRLKEAREKLDSLEEPVYDVYSRREMLGSEGYRLYTSIAEIVDSLSGIFPIFLYLVAALVTSTTMSRFVDEERINAGTLKALGYSNRDIIKKFTIYGLLSSMIGTTIGVLMGHTLLPLIVHNTYATKVELPMIKLSFYPKITIIAFVLGFISAVVPAYLVAKKELKEKASQLLLPKPPAKGSKIFLERIGFIWNKMSFTKKVTARNIFRYKQRMLMTIFGVCGGVALLFAGFGVQHSIQGIGDAQFQNIIKYDLIIANEDSAKDDTIDKINKKLQDDVRIQTHKNVHFEEITKVAGANKDAQKIKLIVPSDHEKFDDYINLRDRKTGEKIALDKGGAVISERFAKLIKAKVGDEIDVKDSKGNDHKIKVKGICEMYLGHFAFMSKESYEKTFNTKYKNNGSLISLKDKDQENIRNVASDFMKQEGVKGIVQNISLENQIHTIVLSLNKIMIILIVTATLLTVVIISNLTNINVAERIRELSTIKVLGFFNKEVTMYIYKETSILSIIGILVGFLFGGWLHHYIITAVPPEEVMFNPQEGAISYIVPTVIVTVIIVALGFVVNRKLKNVNMLEALKSVE